MPQVPEFLAIGHVTQDIHPDGTFSLGGTVTFAASTANRLGLSAGIVTCASSDLAVKLPVYLPDIALQVYPSAETTTFANYYEEGFRTQYLYARAASLQVTDIPQSWHNAPIVLLGPLAQELSPEFVTFFAHRSGALLAVTPQGWLRRWDANGRVRPTPWQEAEQVLPLIDVLILSHDDLLPFAGGDRQQVDAILARWSTHIPLLVVTGARHGATLYYNSTIQNFPAYPTQEVDPTGAGDVFAAAMLIDLYKYGSPEHAVNFANCVASFSIEKKGIQGIPTLDMVEKRLKE